MPNERRFLIASSLARLIQKERGLGSRIVEGYFAPRPDRKQIVRIENGGAQLILVSTSQAGAVEEERADVPRAHAEALLDVAQGKVAFARGTVPLQGGREVALDRFMIPTRIDILSVTFPEGERPDAFQPPAWFGREITGEGGFELNAIAMNGAPDVGDLNVSNSALESLLDSLEQRFGFRSATSTAGSRTAPPARAMTPPPPRPEPFRNEPAAIEPPPVIEAPAPEEAPAETRDAMAEAGPAGEPAVTPSADEAPPAVPPTNDPDDVLASLARALAPRRPGQR
jgi:CYTH domain-containing protein